MICLTGISLLCFFYSSEGSGTTNQSSFFFMEFSFTCSKIRLSNGLLLFSFLNLGSYFILCHFSHHMKFLAREKGEDLLRRREILGDVWSSARFNSSFWCWCVNSFVFILCFLLFNRQMELLEFCFAHFVLLLLFVLPFVYPLICYIEVWFLILKKIL